MTNEALVATLIARRHELGLSQIAVAAAIGCSRFQILRFEHGRLDFSFLFLQHYAEAVRCTLLTLIVPDNS